MSRYHSKKKLLWGRYMAACEPSQNRSVPGGLAVACVSVLMTALWLMLMRSAEGIRDTILVCASFFLQVLIVAIWALRWWRCDAWTGWWIALVGTAVLWAWQLRLFIRIRRIVPVYA